MWLGSCERKRENCEISHIDRTNKALTIYKIEQKLLSLCICVAHGHPTSGEPIVTGTQHSMESGEPAENRHPISGDQINKQIYMYKHIYTQGRQVRIQTLHLLVKSQ